MEKKVYTPRTTAPVSGNKWYTKKGYSNGVNTLPLGSPLAWAGSVLSNCTGYAFGRVAEMAGELTTMGCWPGNNHPGNAQNWFAAPDGYERGQEPRIGAIACWKATNGKSGHVAVVEKVQNSEVFVSDSAWRSRKFGYYAYPKNMSKSGFVFQGFIYPKYEYVEEVKPEPVEEELKVGDKVKILKSGNANSMGTGNSARSGLIRNIIRIYPKRPYPYQVGNKSGTTGFYKRDALKKL